MEMVMQVRELADKYEGFLLDVWGLAHDGHQPFDGFVTCLEKLKDANKQVLFLSNAPRRRRLVEAQLTQLGIPRDLYLQVHSSGEDAFEYLAEHKDTLGPLCYPLHSVHHGGLLTDLNLTLTEDIQEADFMLNTGPDNLVVAEHEELLQKAVRGKVPMICVNPDVSVILKDKVVLCAGALAQRYQELGGEVSYHGKPEPEIYVSALKKFQGLEKNQIVALGDSLTTDILGANQAGLDAGLVLTGLEGRAMNVAPGSLPDPQRMKEICEAKKAYPTYVLPSFIWEV